MAGVRAPRLDALDLIDAVGTLMVDARSGQWSQELCGLIGWPMASLPPIVRPKSRVGSVTAEAARAHTRDLRNFGHGD